MNRVLKIERLFDISLNVVWLHFEDGAKEILVTNDGTAFAKASELMRLINSAVEHQAKRLAA